MPPKPSSSLHPFTPSHFHTFIAACAAALLLNNTARADWTLTNASFAKSPHLTVNTWNPNDGLSATDSTGKLVQFQNRDIVSLNSGAAVSSDTALRRWKLTLRNGDVLYGEANGFSGQSLLFRVSEFSSPGPKGGLTIPLKSVANLTSPKFAASGDSNLLSAPDKDIIRLANNDKSQGLITDMDSAKISIAIEGSDQPTVIPLTNVSAVSFGVAAPPRSVPPISIRLNLISGSSYTIPLDAAHAFSWTLSTIKFKDSAGHDQTIDDASHFVASVDLLGGRVVYLSELDPLSDEQVSFLGTKWPMLRNQNVLGQPLRVDHITYDHGIGVHTQDTLTYQLDGSFETLSLRVALDDSAAPQGEAKASIILDGKTLWQSNTLKPGQLSQELNLPIAGGKRLELHADPTTRLDVLGRLDWLNIALKRK